MKPSKTYKVRNIYATKHRRYMICLISMIYRMMHADSMTTLKIDHNS